MLTLLQSLFFSVKAIPTISPSSLQWPVCMWKDKQAGIRACSSNTHQWALWLCSVPPLDWELTLVSAPALTSSSSAAPCLGQGRARSLWGAGAAAARHVSSQQAWRGDAAQIGTSSPSPADIRRAHILSHQIKH